MIDVFAFQIKLQEAGATVEDSFRDAKILHEMQAEEEQRNSIRKAKDRERKRAGKSAGKSAVISAPKDEQEKTPGDELMEAVAASGGLQPRKRMLVEDNGEIYIEPAPILKKKKMQTIEEAEEKTHRDIEFRNEAAEWEMTIKDTAYIERAKERIREKREKPEPRIMTKGQRQTLEAEKKAIDTTPSTLDGLKTAGLLKKASQLPAQAKKKPQAEIHQAKAETAPESNPVSLHETMAKIDLSKTEKKLDDADVMFTIPDRIAGTTFINLAEIYGK